MELRREYTVDTLAELASSDQREIRVLDAADTALTVSFTYDDAWVDISATGALTVWLEG